MVRRLLTRTCLSIACVGAALAGVALSPAAVGAAVPVAGRPSAPIALAPGVTLFTESWTGAEGRERAALVSVDLTRAKLASIASGGVIGDSQPVAQTAAAIHALAGINGDFFSYDQIADGGVVHGGQVLKSPSHNWPAQLAVHADGTAGIGPVEYDTAVTQQSNHLTKLVPSLNNLTDAGNGTLTLLTPALVAVHTGQCTFARANLTGQTLSVTTIVHAWSVPTITGPGRALAACGGRNATWLASLRRGDKLTLSGGMADKTITELISGGRVLVSRGALTPLSTTGMTTYGTNPETGVCVSADHKHVLLAVVDGRSWQSAGLTMIEFGTFLIANHCYSAMMFDGGASTTLVAQRSGGVAIINQPAWWGGGRPVADGLYVFRR